MTEKIPNVERPNSNEWSHFYADAFRMILHGAKSVDDINPLTDELNRQTEKLKKDYPDFVDMIEKIRMEVM